MIHKTPQQELTEIRDELIAALPDDILKKMTAYWMKRAEFAARTSPTIVEERTRAVLDGQISICFETADTIGRTLAERIAKDNAERKGGISTAEVTAV